MMGAGVGVLHWEGFRRALGGRWEGGEGWVCESDL